MDNRIKLDWQVCPDGYEIIDFDASMVDWDWPSEEPPPLQPQLPEAAARALCKWGYHLEPVEEPWPGGYSEPTIYPLLLPLSDQLIEIDPFNYEPRLFTHFANTPPSRKGVVDFANRFGMLDRQRPVLEYWFSDIRWMSEIISMWDDRHNRPPDQVNDALNALMPNDETIRPVLKYEGSGSILYLQPGSLRSAMCLQLALDLEEAVNFRRCEECAKFIVIAVGKSRPDRKYCSNACQQRAHRKRKQT